MITACLILIALISVMGVVGGLVMMFEGEGGFFSWWVGMTMVQNGVELFAKFVPALLEMLASAASD